VAEGVQEEAMAPARRVVKAVVYFILEVFVEEFGEKVIIDEKVLEGK
jgi:hypothetical protein